MRAAQKAAWTHLAPWLVSEADFAQAAFAQVSARFLELGNEFLARVRDTGVAGLDGLQDEMNVLDLRSNSEFQFHTIERIASPASPFVFLCDIVLGLVRLQDVSGNAHEFLDQLLEVNSSRVQNDVEERVRKSRRSLEKEIRSSLSAGIRIAENALARARKTRVEGSEAIKIELARMDGLKAEVLSLLSCAEAPRP
jgi:hypothetical protein